MPEDPWAHRETTMRCRTCMWFVLKSAPEDVKVALGRWCGDHKLDEAKL